MESGIFLPVIDQFVDYLIYGKCTGFISVIDFSRWNEDTLNANIYFIIVVACFLIGSFLLIFGGIHSKKRNKKG